MSMFFGSPIPDKDLKDLYLNDVARILNQLNNKMYLIGRLEENMFDREDLVRDYGNMENHITYYSGILMENCQHAMIFWLKIKGRQG